MQSKRRKSAKAHRKRVTRDKIPRPHPPPEPVELDLFEGVLRKLVTTAPKKRGA